VWSGDVAESREIAELMRELGRLNMQVAELRYKLHHHSHGLGDPASDEHDQRLREIAGRQTCQP
jgi:hypothetical protein